MSTEWWGQRGDLNEVSKLSGVLGQERVNGIGLWGKWEKKNRNKHRRFFKFCCKGGQRNQTVAGGKVGPEDF